MVPLVGRNSPLDSTRIDLSCTGVGLRTSPAREHAIQPIRAATRRGIARVEFAGSRARPLPRQQPDCVGARRVARKMRVLVVLCLLGVPVA
eukprot:COSAG02_NODE_21475_length_786_cov_1.937409_1_plen_90_part_10